MTSLVGAQLASLHDMLEDNVGNVYEGREPDGGFRWRTPIKVEPLEMVNHPKHYNGHPSGVECIEVMEHMTCNLGNAFKYGWRYYDKGDPVENLKKMLWYVDRSLNHDTGYLLHMDSMAASHFRLEVMDARRRRIFDRPSPWCEPVRHAMAAICDLHTGKSVDERLRLYDKIQKCIRTAIDDEQCMGRGLEP